MGVYLDPRAGSGELLQYFPSGFAQLLTLDSGDVMGVGDGPNGSICWGVEIKKVTTSDLLQSMEEGRLKEQLGRMQEDFDFRALIVQGDMRSNWQTGHLQVWSGKGARGFWKDAVFGAKKKIMYQHFMSWLMSMLLCSGTFYIHTSDGQTTADTICALHNFFSKPWEDHSSLKVFNDSGDNGIYIPSVAMTVARAMIGGVGWEKAAAAADHFHTPKAIVNASTDEWMEVPGFDTVLSARAVEAANTPHVLRRRTRRKSGQSHSDVQASPGDRKNQKRGSHSRAVPVKATK